MNQKKFKKTVGSWAFFIGVILAFCVGIFGGLMGISVGESTLTLTMAALLVIGIIIGLFNITEKETASFLFSGLALIIASALGSGISSLMPEMVALTWGLTLSAILAIFVPATIIVAIKHVFAYAKD